MTAEREGAIPLAELAAMAKSVQDTVDQIARSLSARTGPGRPPAYLSKLSALEAVAIEAGSAVLAIEAPHDMEGLPIHFDEPDAGVQAIEMFVQSIDALSHGDPPPPEIGDPAAGSLRAFVRSVEGHDQVDVESRTDGRTATARLVPRLVVDSDTDRTEDADPDAPVQIVGKLYEVNLHTHSYRIRDELGRTRSVTVGENLDDRTLARALLGEVVDVVAVPKEREGQGPDHFVAVSIERVQRETADYYTWDLETALEGIEPIESIEDLRIPGIDDDEADAFWHAVND
jgi:hypothetical protein